MPCDLWICRPPAPAAAPVVYTAAAESGGTALPVPRSHSRVGGGHVWAKRGTGGQRADSGNTGTFIFDAPPPPPNAHSVLGNAIPHRLKSVGQNFMSIPP